jgi:hypothetical protein
MELLSPWIIFKTPPFIVIYNFSEPSFFMRIHIGELSLGGVPDDTLWNKCHVPIGRFSVLAISLIICVFLAVISYLLITKFTNFKLELFHGGFSFFLWIPTLAAHEILHAVTHPGFGLSDKTIFGFIPSELAVFAAYDGERGKKNVLMDLASPFFIISIIPLFIGIFFGIKNDFIGIIIIMNSVVSGGDFFRFFYILFYIPSGAKLKNFGQSGYWRMQD